MFAVIGYAVFPVVTLERDSDPIMVSRFEVIYHVVFSINLISRMRIA